MKARCDGVFICPSILESKLFSIKGLLSIIEVSVSRIKEWIFWYLLVLIIKFKLNKELLSLFKLFISYSLL